MKYNRQTVLITGASEGIGRATARLFAAQGYHLILLARNLARLEELAAELSAQHAVDCTPLQADVQDAEEAWQRIGHVIEGKFLAAAIINAGVGLYGPFAETKWEDTARLLRTNLDGALACTRAVLPVFRRQRAGSLVLISSTIGKRALPYNAVYCATKQALHGFADAIRLEMKPWDVHVGVVCPARTATAFFERMTYAVPQKSRRNIPTDSPETVARAVMHCVRLRRREVVVSMVGKLFSFVGYHFPRLSDYLLYRNVPRPETP
ncbi:MAG: SDR family NAD(P)-dependent oxidoreductase [Bacteroidetes bacterium]|nr:SDR family NAD(P)-dependent oxidoreductase [Bacteroidota bacterium]